MCRSTLLFATGKALEEKGFVWLKIHLSNLFGHDKISFDDRVKFTEANMANIMDSADNPLDGSRWWTKAENPWQVGLLHMKTSHNAVPGYLYRIIQGCSQRKPKRIYQSSTSSPGTVATVFSNSLVRMVLAMDYNTMRRLGEI
jgi:hypothetical protein